MTALPAHREALAEALTEALTPALNRAARLSIAPMMDWTDRHCRAFHRTLTRQALLYTEMVTADAILHGPRDRLLAYDAAEHPVALQLGGSDPAKLAAAVRAAAPYGYDEINLNLGCPSDRVQSGCFGAVLMRSPDLVAECLAAMIDAAPAGVEVTAKCRIGVDDDTPEEVLPAFLNRLRATGIRRVTIHARKAWLQGLSPKENREIPPLDYPLVLAMKRAFPDLHLSLNGGVATLAGAEALLAQGIDGVMIGRAAYHAPWDMLGRTDTAVWGTATPCPTATDALRRFLPYIEAELTKGARLHQITRHILGLFHGRPGGRHFRRILSEGASRPGAGVPLVEEALAAISEDP